MKQKPWLGLFGFAVVLFLAGSVSAIPAFSRTYQVSCARCHAPFPRLNPYGEKFAARGFRPDASSGEPSAATVETGDALLQLASEFPLAVRLDGYAAYQEHGSQEIGFQWPWMFRVLSGGTVSSHVSYFVDAANSGSGLGMEDAYLHLGSLFDAPMDVKIGRFKISDQMFLRNLRLQRNDYSIYALTIGMSRKSLDADQGMVVTFHAPGHIETAVGVFNGRTPSSAPTAPIRPGQPGGAAVPYVSFNEDVGQAVTLRLAHTGGPLRLGLFGYYGRDKLEGEFGSAGALKNTNHVSYWGPDLALDLGSDFRLNLQYLRRKDDHAVAAYGFQGLTVRPIEMKGGFAEGIWLPRGPDGRWALSLLYNRVRMQGVPVIRPEWQETVYYASDREDLSLAASILTLRDLRFSTEATYDFEGNVWGASIGMVAAF